MAVAPIPAVAPAAHAHVTVTPQRPTVYVAMIASAVWGIATLTYVLGSPSQSTMSWLNTWWGAFLGLHLFLQVLPGAVWRRFTGAGTNPPVNMHDHWSSIVGAALVAIAIGLYFYSPPPQAIRFYYDAFLMISAVGAFVDVIVMIGEW